MILSLYKRLVLRHPIVSLIVIALAAVFLISNANEVYIDASSDSLILEDDDDMRYHQQISSRYKDGHFLIVAYQPKEDIFQAETLDQIKRLQQALEQVPIVDHVVSIRNVPLLNSPKIPLDQVGKDLPSIDTDATIDLEMARKELLTSPLYQELLMSKAGDMTALIIYLKENPQLAALQKERNELRTLKHTQGIDNEQTKQLAIAQQQLLEKQAQQASYEHEQIEQIRKILDTHRQHATLFLGGVPMIVADIIQFIKNDIVVFSTAIVIFLILALAVIFRRLRWVLIPISACLLTTAMMLGLLGWLDWNINVISANFISILLIITMSMNIHISVYYREQQALHPQLGKQALIEKTFAYITKPCFYMVLTTLIAFLSLIVSGIRPVIDFGYIMAMGLVLSFVLTFTLVPSLLSLTMRDNSTLNADFTSHFTTWCGRFTAKHTGKITVVSFLILFASVLGALKLDVENRFIDYFKKDTEIYQGMLTLDRNLGGTTPLDLILSPPPENKNITELPSTDSSAQDDAFLDDYFEEVNQSNTNEPQSYWFTPPRLEQIKEIHRYFERRPEIGKVLSLATLIQLIEQLNNDKPLNDFEANLIPRLLPDSINELLLYPYFFADTDELRFSTRIIDSDSGLRRNELLSEIKQDLENMGYAKEQFRLTNMLVLYNNMLQSLFQSQIATLGTVFFVILLLLMVLFRSVYIAFIGIIPNFLSAAIILGIMGWGNIPLDLLTIAIAAITIGISVDNTIHYVVRFKKEFAQSHNYIATMQQCHKTIGRALYYTSSVIVIGFSCLTLSNFIPNVYFGLLISLAMLSALLGSLFVLPSLLILFKPLGPEQTKQAS